MAIYFFSDAHLGEANKEKESRKLSKLLSLIRQIADDGEKVFILGDLFDFWFEYKHAIPRHHLRIIFHLAALVESGIQVHYITGNHDFWMGDFLSTEAGFIIHRDHYETREQGKRIFMIHGDGLAASDKGYRILRKILRNKFNIWLYRKLPPDWGIPLAGYVARSSRMHTSSRSPEFLKDYREYAERKLSEGFDAVIMGHLHEPIYQRLDAGVYINTGDFIENFSYIKMQNGEFSLEYI